jgi:hypothetical protein
MRHLGARVLFLIRKYSMNLSLHCTFKSRAYIYIYIPNYRFPFENSIELEKTEHTLWKVRIYLIATPN